MTAWILEHWPLWALCWFGTGAVCSLLWNSLEPAYGGPDAWTVIYPIIIGPIGIPVVYVIWREKAGR